MNDAQLETIHELDRDVKDKGKEVDSLSKTLFNMQNTMVCVLFEKKILKRLEK